MVTPHLYGKLKTVRAAARRRALLERRPYSMTTMRRQPASLALAAAAAAAVAVPLSGCGSADPVAGAAPPPASAPQAVDKLRPRPRAIDPTAGVPAGSSGVVQQRDASLPQPRSDEEIRAELAKSGIPAGDGAGLTAEGLAVAPLGAPPVVQAVIAAGNQIARLPYRYGGGHATWIDTAYDCSASISFAFAAAGMISSPMVSGQLAQWGEAGPGRWITIYAHGGHAFMEVAGLRFDTSGLRATGSRWQTASRSTGGFAVRHPPGL